MSVVKIGGTLYPTEALRYKVKGKVVTLTPQEPAWIDDLENYHRLNCPNCRGVGVVSVLHIRGYPPDDKIWARWTVNGRTITASAVSFTCPVCLGDGRRREE